MAFVSGGEPFEAHNLEYISDRCGSVFAALHPLFCLYGIRNTVCIWFTCACEVQNEMERESEHVA